MKKYIFFFLTWSALFSGYCTEAQVVPAKPPIVIASPAQTVSPEIDVPTAASLLKTIIALQKQVTALQKQVDANYKAQDFVIGLLQNKDVQLANTINETNARIAAFTVTATPSNMADVFTPMSNYLQGGYYRSVIIDNAACNNNPGAIVMVSAQRSGFFYNLPTGIAVTYDKTINKWKIEINPDITNSMIEGHANPAVGTYVVAVASYSPYQINKGDKFNVVVVK